MRLILFWTALAFCSPCPASAAWNQASSKHFIVYSPHGGSASETARRMIADLDGGKAKDALSELRQPSVQALKSR